LNKKGKLILILKKINTDNINKCIDIFTKVMQDFGDSMDQLTKEFASSKKENSKKDMKNLEKIWGKDNFSLKFNVKICQDSPKNLPEYQTSRDEINLEKLWGKRK
jgi:hypothetical protein